MAGLDSIRLYLKEIGRTPLLSADEEVELGHQVQQWIRLRDQPNPTPEQCRLIHLGKRAKNRMIQANLRLVVSVAKRYQGRGLEFLDLIQEGSIGLDRAVEKFDPRAGYKFSTYAYWWIRQGITRAIATSSRTIRLPVHITDKLNKVKRATRDLCTRLGRVPTAKELADELQISVRDLQDLLKQSRRVASLDVKVGADKDTPILDLLSADEADPMEQAEWRELCDRLDEWMTVLNPKERYIVQARHGLMDGEPRTLAEIGRSLNLSRERVRQLNVKAAKKMRERALQASVVG